MKKMKIEKRNERLAESQNLQSIKDAFSGYRQSNLWVQSIYEMSHSANSLTVRSRVEAFTPLKGQGSGFLFAKGLPGYSHSPAAQIRGHPPAEKTGLKGNKVGKPTDPYQIQQIKKTKIQTITNF